MTTVCEPAKVRSQSRQWLACLSATLSMVATGTVYGWTTTILTRLMADSEPVHIDNDESSWIVALTIIGSMLGSFIGAWLADEYGRKKCMLMTSVFYIIGWLTVLAASSVFELYCARMILGIGVGISYVVNPMYVSEVAENNIRGALSTFISINIFTGSLITCSAGPWLSYNQLCLLLILIVLLFVASFVWFPETPYYLAAKGRNSEAVEALAYFRGLEDQELARHELNEVLGNMGKQFIVEERRDLDIDREEEQLTLGKKLRLLSLPSNRRALVIVIGLIAGQQLSGSFSTMQYLEKLFREAHIGINSSLATVIVVAVGMLSGFLTTLTIDVFGRRPLLIISSLGSAMTLGALAIYLYFNAHHVDLSFINYLPVIDVILFQIFYQVGLGTIPSLLTGELFPTNVKGVAGAIITLSDGLMGFTVSKLYQVIGDAYGNHSVYFVFCYSCFMMFIFVFFIVPETRCKPFSYIQEVLASNRYPWRKDDAESASDS